MSDFTDRLIASVPEFGPYYAENVDPELGDTLVSGVFGVWIADEVQRDGPDTELVRRVFATVEELVDHDVFGDAIVVGFLEHLMGTEWAIERMEPKTREAHDGLVSGWQRVNRWLEETPEGREVAAKERRMQAMFDELDEDDGEPSAADRELDMLWELEHPGGEQRRRRDSD